MGAAAYTLPVDRQSDWLIELERILDHWETIPCAARNAVAQVVESLLADPSSSATDTAYAHALIAQVQGSFSERLRPA